jgi:hypothetical protein
LGFRAEGLPEKIDWHQDFRTGRRWPRRYWTKVNISFEDFSDIKIPWELSRFHHAVRLGQAFVLTGDETFVQEFVRQTSDWIQENPVGYGVNWVCPMEVAIRAANWIWAWHLFQSASGLRTPFQDVFLRALFQHGRFIFRNLEDVQPLGGANSNHLISNGAGLLYLGVFFRGHREAERWLRQAIALLTRETQRQVDSDGVDYEQSIGYHRLVLELLVCAVLLARRNRIEIPDHLLVTLEKMLSFTMHYLKPDGSAPHAGDADDGRLHQLSIEEVESQAHLYLLSLGAVQYGRGDFKHYSRRFHEETLWLLGGKGKERYDSLVSDSTSLESKAFPQSGFYVMRSPDRYLLIRGGGVVASGSGAHAHCDALSFELFAGNRTLIVDPGTYLYTGDPPARNLFRSSAYHNTVSVDGQEINRFDETQLFRMCNDARPKVIQWKTTREYDLFVGEHYGYMRLAEPVVHRRYIYFDKRDGYWVVRDSLLGKGCHTFRMTLHLPPVPIVAAGMSEDLRRRMESLRNPVLEQPAPINQSLAVRSQFAEGINLLVVPVGAEEVSLRIEEGWVSPQYGVRIPAPIVVYRQQCLCPAEFVTLLYPL